ncbi:DUF4062 domain-containing protein [Vibrio mediterranei]
MDKRYQVFVSSTYADLKEERQHVTQTLMEMDCIPAGMEMFPATDEEQWEFIKRVIDDCDYYLLIIGGRYGSTTKEGISYTEKEYDYAVEKGIKVIALLHSSPDNIPVAKSELDPTLRESLQAFRDKVSNARLVKFWSNPEELPGLVALSLSKTIKLFPATGWVRATSFSNEELLGELNELRKHNTQLTDKLSKLSKPEAYEVDNLASLDSLYKVSGTCYTDYGKKTWNCEASWGEMFSIISPYLIQVPNQQRVKEILSYQLIKKSMTSFTTASIDDQIFQTISIQFRALGLVSISNRKTTQGGWALFWTLTPKGEQLMVQLRAISVNDA